MRNRRCPCHCSTSQMQPSVPFTAHCTNMTQRASVPLRVMQQPSGQRAGSCMTPRCCPATSRCCWQGARLLIIRVGQNHTCIGKYGVCPVFLAGKSPFILSYTVRLYGSGQPVNNAPKKAWSMVKVPECPQYDLDLSAHRLIWI